MSRGSDLAGPVGGASDDAGVEYRRSVAAYIVSSALAGNPVPVRCLTGAGLVRSVALETDDPVDDIRVNLESGETIFLQAKLTLTAGRSLEKAVDQWRKAALDGLDPDTHRLVIVANKLSGSMEHLQRVLERERDEDHGERTGAESAVVEKVDALLGDLSDEMKATVRRCAAIWKLEVAEPESASTQIAREALKSVLVDQSATHISAAWLFLTNVAGQTARLRGAAHITKWVRRLREEGFTLSGVGSAPAAVSTRRAYAIERYATRLQLGGNLIDLRPVGAQIPPIAFATADGSVRVYPTKREPADARDLLWAFLHRHRVVLTGLPGGGKSTAARRLAADLIADDNLPFPVMASLRNINPNNASEGIREQIIGAALRNASDADRVELRDEINRRFDGDEPIAVILDALDEAYDSRDALTVAVDTFAKTMNDNTFFLLTTRSVAFAQAATLKWAALELGPPEHTRSTARAILEATAAHTDVPEEIRDSWVSVRADWVNAHLAQDKVLAETPLMVALLTLLACGRTTAQLPTTRGAVLKAVVHDFVGRQEVAGRISSQLTRLEESEQALAGMAGFAREASILMANPTGASVTAVVEAVTHALYPEWIVAKGQAQATATTLVRSFDEAGVFVIDDDQYIAPRIQLLAEVGDAIQAMEHPATIESWVDARLNGGQHESVTLACLLSTEAVSACVKLLSDDVTGGPVARVLAEAEREGAVLTAPQSLALTRRLALLIERPTYEGWQAARMLMNLGHFPEEAAAAFESAATAYDPGRRRIVATHLLMRFPTRLEPDARRNLLKETFSLPGLPTLEREHPRTDEFSFLEFLDDGGMRDAQLYAARTLLAEWPEFAEVVAARIDENTPRGFTNDLLDALRTTGYAEIAEQASSRYGPGAWGEIGGMEERKVDELYPRILRDLSALPTMEIPVRQRISMVELGVLLDELGVLSWGEAPIYGSGEEHVSTYLDVAMTLLNVDPRVISAQALEARRRMGRSGSVEPVSALRTGSRDRIARWDDVADPAAAALVLTKALALPLHHTAFPMQALARGPREVVEPLLTDAVVRLQPSPRHQKNAAVALTAVSNGEAARPWLTGKNPFLREVAAWACTLDERIMLLRDPDRGVRLGALELIIKEAPPELEQILSDFLDAPECGWACENCQEVNETWDVRDACSTCLHSAPTPRQLAKTTLREGI